MAGEVIDPLTPDLLDACAALSVAVFTAPPWNEPWTIELARLRLGGILADARSLGFVMVEETPRRPIGLILGHRTTWLNGPEFFLNELCVHVAWQGKGIGSRLLTRLEETLRQEGMQSIVLNTVAGAPAEAFYVRHGYATNQGVISMAKRL